MNNEKIELTSEQIMKNKKKEVALTAEQVLSNNVVKGYESSVKQLNTKAQDVCIKAHKLYSKMKSHYGALDIICEHFNMNKSTLIQQSNAGMIYLSVKDSESYGFLKEWTPAKVVELWKVNHKSMGMSDKIEAIKTYIDSVDTEDLNFYTVKELRESIKDFNALYIVKKEGNEEDGEIEDATGEPEDGIEGDGCELPSHLDEVLRLLVDATNHIDDYCKSNQDIPKLHDVKKVLADLYVIIESVM